MDNTAPSSFAAFLVWVSTGPGITALILWLNGLKFWISNTDDSRFVTFLKKGKTVVLIVIATGGGIFATLATTYVPGDVITSLEPYYKLMWTVINIVVSLNVGQVIIFRVQVMKRNLNLKTDEHQATIQAIKDAKWKSPVPMGQHG